MGKGDAMTPKAIANRIKAKGLQKLRWYCQMCEKQCRDENGFKCHCESESHQRQMELFAATPSRFTGDFSRQFESGYMDLVKRVYRSRRVLANRVYNEYIQDKDHVHMNATQWETLSAFVKYLGREGKCIVEETPKGWYITYIETDPAILARQKAFETKERAELDDETRTRRLLEKRMQAARELEQKRAAIGLPSSSAVDAPSEVIAQAVAPSEAEGVAAAAVQKVEVPAEAEGALSSAADAARVGSTGEEEQPPQAKRMKSSDDIPSQTAEATVCYQEPATTDGAHKKDEGNEKEFWVREGIVVKVMAKDLAGGAYWKKKGTIEAVEGGCIARLRMLDTGDLIRIDQEQLETVLPAIGGKVVFVRGKHRGTVAVLQSICVDRFCASVKTDDGTAMGSVDYDDISKLA